MLVYSYSLNQTPEELNTWNEIQAVFRNLNQHEEWRLSSIEGKAVFMCCEQKLFNLLSGSSETGNAKIAVAMSIILSDIGERFLVTTPSEETANSLALRIHKMLPATDTLPTTNERGQKRFKPTLVRDTVPYVTDQYPLAGNQTRDQYPLAGNQTWVMSEAEKAQHKALAVAFYFHTLSSLPAFHELAINQAVVGSWKEHLLDVRKWSLYDKVLSTTEYLHLITQAILDVKGMQGVGTVDQYTDLEAAQKIEEVCNTSGYQQKYLKFSKETNAAMDLLKGKVFQEVTIVVTTLDNAVNRQLLEHFKPSIIIQEESHKFSEWRAIGPLVQHESINSIVLIGDLQTELNSPTLPLFNRLANQGIDVLMLNVQ